MAKTSFTSVDEYIASFPPAVQEVLRAVRLAISEGAPKADERISYQMPAYWLNGWLIYFSGFKDHYSLFCPRPDALLRDFGDALSLYDVSKSTIKLPLHEPVPVDLIRDMARHRADEYGKRAPARRGRR
jgi:uncharacterized protein YdhG (YjbR/CyaY superfamily)